MCVRVCVRLRVCVPVDVRSTTFTLCYNSVWLVAHNDCFHSVTFLWGIKGFPSQTELRWISVPVSMLSLANLLVGQERIVSRICRRGTKLWNCVAKNQIGKNKHILEWTGAVVSFLNVLKWQKSTRLPVFGSGPISCSIWCRSHSQVLVSSRRLTKQTLGRNSGLL